MLASKWGTFISSLTFVYIYIYTPSRTIHFMLFFSFAVGIKGILGYSWCSGTIIELLIVHKMDFSVGAWRILVSQPPNQQIRVLKCVPFFLKRCLKDESKFWKSSLKSLIFSETMIETFCYLGLACKVE